MLGKGQGNVHELGLYVRGPGLGEGVLLVVRGALTGHFLTNFVKPKLQSSKGLVGLVWSAPAPNLSQVPAHQSLAPGRFCSPGLKADQSQT